MNTRRHPAPAVSPRGRVAPGFTLIELLVSVVVLTLLTLALFGVLNAATTGWNRAEQRADSSREARAALDVIAHDLQTMVKSADFDFIAWKKGGAASGVNIADYATPPATGDTIFFYSLQPRAAQDPDPAKRNFGQLCRVGFYLHYGRDASGRSSYKLHRHFEMSGEVGNLGANFSVTAKPASDEALARNVTDFFLTPYWKAADGTLTATEPADGSARKMPAMIEVRLLAFNNGTAALFPNRQAWEGTNPAFRRPRLAGGQAFTTRVDLPGDRLP